MSTVILANGEHNNALTKKYPHLNQAQTGCLTCHSSTNGSVELNSYGEVYLNSDGNLDEIEVLDSDNDGFTNLMEILESTNPGNPYDRPEPDFSGVVGHQLSVINNKKLTPIQRIISVKKLSNLNLCILRHPDVLRTFVSLVDDAEDDPALRVEAIHALVKLRPIVAGKMVMKLVGWMNNSNQDIRTATTEAINKDKEVKAAIEEFKSHKNPFGNE